MVRPQVTLAPSPILVGQPQVVKQLPTVLGSKGTYLSEITIINKLCHWMFFSGQCKIILLPSKQM